MILTWREEIIDKITNGALTVWCEAVEKAISLIDGNPTHQLIILENQMSF